MTHNNLRNDPGLSQPGEHDDDTGLKDDRRQGVLQRVVTLQRPVGHGLHRDRAR